MSWVRRQYSKDGINRKPEDRKNDQRTENPKTIIPKNYNTKKMNYYCNLQPICKPNTTFTSIINGILGR